MKILSKLTIVLLSVCAGITATAQCWEMVRTGANHCIAIKNNGTLWAWGSNSDGQLGSGGSSDIWTPYQIGVDNDWSTVGTGKSSTHNLAIKDNGTLWAWGYNFYGQLGNVPGAEELLPIQIGTDANWSKVACGMFFSIAIKTDGTLWGWGSNNFGQVNNYKPHVDFFLFDAKGDGYGGNGIAFDWSILKKYDNQKPYFLAGGISLDNLDVLETIIPKPYAMDVNSKFEIEPALKDIEKLEELLDKIRPIEV